MVPSSRPLPQAKTSASAVNIFPSFTVLRDDSVEPSHAQLDLVSYYLYYISPSDYVTASITNAGYDVVEGKLSFTISLQAFGTVTLQMSASGSIADFTLKGMMAE